MLEQIVTSLLTAAGIYLAIGIVGVILLHLRVLPAIDPETRTSGPLFRTLITPGLIVFWPVLLLKWRRASQGSDIAGAEGRPIGPNGDRRWHGVATTGSLLLCPCILAVAMFARISAPDTRGAPSQVIFSSRLYTVESKLGNYFQSIPASVLLARSTARQYGLVFRFPPDAAMPPAALYWSATPADTDSRLPPDATYLGTVWAGEELWIALPEPEMRYAGYWLTYSFLNQTVAYVPSFGTRMKEFQ